MDFIGGGRVLSSDRAALENAVSTVTDISCSSSSPTGWETKPGSPDFASQTGIASPSSMPGSPVAMTSRVCTRWGDVLLERR
jgi:hypothetical protein